MKRYVLVVGLVSFLPNLMKADLIAGSNAIVNGNAETGTISGWNGNFTTVKYGTAGGFPAVTDPGPANRGTYFFAGGESIAFASGTQSLNVSNASSQIDAGTFSYVLSGYLGGFTSQTDFATLTVNFLSSSNALLGTNSIGPVTSTQRSNQTGLLFTNTSGLIPVGTQNLVFTLAMTRQQGDYDDGYADNLSFVASQTQTPPAVTPEPSSLVLLSTGLVAFANEARRRRNLAQRTS